MRPREWPLRSRVTAVAALVFLGLGLGLDLGVARPQMGAFRRLQSERATLRTRLAEQQSRKEECRRLSEYVAAEDLGPTDAGEGLSDPLTYIADQLTRARLDRLELGVVGGSVEPDVRQTRFFLRAQGSYPRVLEFVRLVESGSRLVTVDGISIKVVAGSNSLEFRAHLSVFDPAGDS